MSIKPRFPSKIIFPFLFFIMVATAACGPGPTDGYKKLYSAVKSKETEAIKAQMSKKTIDFAAMAAQRNNTPIEKVFENGFTATTFAETIPEIRDERINGNMGAIEVWNERSKRWEDLPFIKEGSDWKLAVGDLFAGTFKSPGKGRSIRELESANAVSNRPTPVNIPANAFKSAPSPNQANAENK